MKACFTRTAFVEPIARGRFRANVETTRALLSQDPTVQAGKYDPEYLSWMVPSGMVIPGTGAAAQSDAEVPGRWRVGPGD